MTSLTPPRRQPSSWQTSMAPAWNICLNMTRLWQCSPVATRTGATSARTIMWPRMSSGLVGSSIQYGSTTDSARTLAIASGTSHTWLASSIRSRIGPISSRMIWARRRSSGRSRPTFILNASHPSAIASRHRARILSSS